MASTDALQDLVVGIGGLLAAAIMFREDRRAARIVAAEEADGPPRLPASDSDPTPEPSSAARYWRARWPARMVAVGMLVAGIVLLSRAAVTL